MRSILLFSLALGLLCNLGIAHSDESTVNKIKDEAGDIKTDSKKMARKGARNFRKATGNDNIINDAKDQGNDIKDDVSNSASKLKRRAKTN